MVLWTAGILLALGLAWFVGAVVVPVWQVRSKMGHVQWFVSGPVTKVAGGEEIVADLGGQETAARKLTLYLCMPRAVAPNKHYAVVLLRDIGPIAKSAIPALEPLLKDADESMRFAAAEALKKIRSEEETKP